MRSTWLPVIKVSRKWSLIRADQDGDDGLKVNADVAL